MEFSSRCIQGSDLILNGPLRGRQHGLIVIPMTICKEPGPLSSPYRPQEGLLTRRPPVGVKLELVTNCGQGEREKGRPDANWRFQSNGTLRESWPTFPVTLIIIYVDGRTDLGPHKWNCQNTWRSRNWFRPSSGTDFQTRRRKIPV